MWILRVKARGNISPLTSEIPRASGQLSEPPLAKDFKHVLPTIKKGNHMASLPTDKAKIPNYFFFTRQAN